MASIWLLVCLILCVCLFIFIYFIKIYRIIEFKGFCPSKGIFIKSIFFYEIYRIYPTGINVYEKVNIYLFIF